MGSGKETGRDGRQDSARRRACKGLSSVRSGLFSAGAESLTDDELLTLWLGLRDPEQAADLCRRYGSLSALIRAPADRLLAEPGLGAARISRLLAGLAVVEREALARLAQPPLLSCSSSVRRFLRLKLAHLPREVFACLFLDNRHRLIRFEILFLGTVDRASVHPREVLRRALELNSAAVIFAHNHPSGIAEPSASDLTLTRDLTDLLNRIDVRVLDHLVVGRGSEVSFAERGLLGD